MKTRFPPLLFLLVVPLLLLAACESPEALVGPDGAEAVFDISIQTVVVEQVEPLAGPESGYEARSLNQLGRAAGFIYTSSGGRRAAAWEAQGYTVLQNPFSSSFIQAKGLNNRGEVVGEATNQDLSPAALQAIYWNRSAQATTLNSTGLPASAEDINDGGVIVGRVTGIVGGFTQPRFVAAVWDGPASPPWLLTWPVPDRGYQAIGINNQGQIAGNGSVADGISRAAVWENRVGPAGFLPLPDDLTSSVATGINELGAVAGYGHSGGAPFALLWPDGPDGEAIRLADRASQALGLNNLGQAVGYLSIGGSETPALFMDGDAFPLAWPSPWNGFAYGINDDGVVVGAESTEVNLNPASFRWQVPIRASVEVEPGSTSIRVGGGGKINVVVYGSPFFSVHGLDAGTLSLGDESGTDTAVLRNRNGRLDVKYQDVNRNGHTDLVLAFDRRELVANGDLRTDLERLVLLGRRLDGRSIRGVGAVNVVP